MKKLFKYLYSILPFKKQLFSLLRVLRPPASLYKYLHFKGQFTVRFNGKSFQLLHHGFQLENEVFWEGLTGGWEKVSMDLWIKLCSFSEVIMDVGANTGIYSLVAKTENPSAQVHAFEPVKRVFEKLCMNNSLNGFDIHCTEAAASDTDGEAVIYDDLSEHIYSVAVNTNIAGLKNAAKVQIKTVKLSTYIREHKLKKLDLLKIDVETHEPEVLQGLKPFLEQYRPSLLIEILNEDVAAKVMDILGELGYMYFDIDEKGPPKKRERISKSSHYNYLICTPETAIRLNLSA